MYFLYAYALFLWQAFWWLLKVSFRVSTFMSRLKGEIQKQAKPSVKLAIAKRLEKKKWGYVLNQLCFQLHLKA